ncbi:hypothetical protein EYC80_005059 [Monilinia laxa]|uniref:Uncharacterized protein n=1 Tax=Monilinia laxa TaxID=61186 RepID=A0A5N6KJ02_MONLA|nr:hypothetical protein EYC80_005059 [Monilinia laxa]
MSLYSYSPCNKKIHTSCFTDFQASCFHHSNSLRIGTQNPLPDMNRAVKSRGPYLSIASKFGMSMLSQNRTAFHQFKSIRPSDSYVCRTDLKYND